MPGPERERLCDEPEMFVPLGNKEVLGKEVDKSSQKAEEPARAKLL